MVPHGPWRIEPAAGPLPVKPGSAPALNFPALWWLVGAGGIALVIALSLVRNAPQIPGDSGGNFGHVLAYATLMGWFARLLPGHKARAAAALALCGLGVALEFAQESTGYRTYDLADMGADALGVALGWLASPPRVPHVIASLDRLLSRLFRRPSRSPP